MRRAWLAGIGAAVATAVVVGAVTFSLVAMPWFMLARVTSPDGHVDHPIIRSALLTWAVPIGALAGLVVGVVVGLWYGRGGRLPAGGDPRPLSERIDSA